MAASDRATGPGAKVVAGLVWFHRWLGVTTCLIFALWFASGTVLLFEPFPSLGPADRAELAERVDLDAVQVAPGVAIAAAGSSASAVRLVQRGGAPVYIVTKTGAVVVIDATSGEPLAPLDPQAAGATSPPIDYDQWIVSNQFDQLRPLYRISLADSAGTVLYRSAVTGEVVQRTTRSQRGWNWVGAVLHWVYFTPLRSSFDAWDQTVWWLSLLCTLVATAGIILGILRTGVALKQRVPSLSFYRVKWLRWHHILGLFSAIFVLGWIVSGWLSMDHGRLFSRGQPTSDQAAGYYGTGFDNALADVRPDALRGLGETWQVDFTTVAGKPIITPSRLSASSARFTGDGVPLADREFEALVRTGITSAWGAAPTSFDPVLATDMYALAEGWPQPSLRANPGRQDLPEVVVDGRNGAILTVMDRSRKAYAWLYYGMHTFNVPGLTTRPQLREMLVLIPLLLGFVFSITGVVIGWRRVKKSV